MENEVSKRLAAAIEYLKRNGYAATDIEIAKRMGLPKSSISMCKSGARTPSSDMMLSFCDIYPISFWWLRSGKGRMIREEMEMKLLMRIDELERKVAELERQLAAREKGLM